MSAPTAAQLANVPTAPPPMVVPIESSSTLPQSTIPSPTLNSGPVSQLPVHVEDDTETYHPCLATHAERNPDSFVQPVRKITKLSDAQKASLQLRRKAEQEEHQRLIEAFDTLLQRHSQEQEELAKEFCIKPEYLDKLKGTSKHYKTKRSVNIENAKIHKKSIEVNQGTLIYIVYWTAV